MWGRAQRRDNALDGDRNDGVKEAGDEDEDAVEDEDGDADAPVANRRLICPALCRVKWSHVILCGR
ncbi:hypothetical protein PsYK624_103770 [Phanerochaete sordida]|uniref:Uncharacterized protein n=1 Tax=Phanerochaete sordida TaxID=48140 RepID=A0A9P3LH12_9APHY|nr:hypothetical protein PsYK624_103770 [Phanerochaete sordida]